MNRPDLVHRHTVPLAASDDAVEADVAPVAAPELPEGTRLLHYEIVGLVGRGGFGVVYLAYDPVRGQHVAIKEYFPAGRVARNRLSQAVAASTPQHQENFDIGLRSFIDEARLLARFDHPSLVKVLHFWEGNGTAYMVMPYYQGPTLAHALNDMGQAPSEAQLLQILHSLLDGLSAMHAVNCLHCDVAPDNILLTDEGALLLDFGAAQRALSRLAPAAPATMLKPGYAPIEQYAQDPALKQGPWTDLYALAAVVHAAVTGHAPPAANARREHDAMRPLSETAGGRYSAGFLAAIDAALAVRPEDRPQSAADFRARLAATVEAPAPAPPTDGLPMLPPGPRLTAQRTRRWPRVGWVVLLLAAAAVGLAAIGYRQPGLADGRPDRSATTAPAAKDAPVAPAAPPLPSPPSPVTAPPSPSPPTAVPSPVRSAAPRPPSTGASAAGASAAAPAPPGRCSEILQSASLGPLSAADATYLKRECRQ